jgi:hypothetical protein
MKVFSGFWEIIWSSLTTWYPMKEAALAIAILFVVLTVLLVRAISKSGRRA